MSINFIKHFIVTTILFFFLCGSVSAEVKISSLPKPPPSAKLRVFVVAVSTEFKSVKRPFIWPVSPEEFERRQKLAIGERLKLQGIYEVVNAGDLRAVMGDQTVASWEWIANDWALAKDVGKALHADYVMLSERSLRAHLQFDTKLINLNTGKQFETSGYIPFSRLRIMTNDQRNLAGAEVIKIQFRRIFHDSKSDLIHTVILKGNIAEKEPMAPERVALPPKEKPSQALPVPIANAPKTQAEAVTPQDTLADSKISEKQLAFEKELEKALSAKDKKTDSPRLVVYDFDAADRLKVVGLILTEALREELHNLGGFVLVNRENILKIMDEYKLQQTSLIDEKQAVKIGKWLAANEAVTGKLDILGNTSILQVKRVDIKTLRTMALGSLKCPTGQEDELLGQMVQLAKTLSQSAR